MRWGRGDDVAHAIGRLEGALEEHTRSDAANFGTLHAELREVHTAVDKLSTCVAGLKGRGGGAVPAAGGAGLIIVLLETLRHFGVI